MTPEQYAAFLVWLDKERKLNIEIFEESGRKSSYMEGGIHQIEAIDFYLQEHIK